MSLPTYTVTKHALERRAARVSTTTDGWLADMARTHQQEMAASHPEIADLLERVWDEMDEEAK